MPISSPKVKLINTVPAAYGISHSYFQSCCWRCCFCFTFLSCISGTTGSTVVRAAMELAATATAIAAEAGTVEQQIILPLCWDRVLASFMQLKLFSTYLSLFQIVY